MNDDAQIFVKYITRECLASTESAVLHSSIPHFAPLDDIAPGNMPALAKALCKLSSVDFVVPEAETSERSFQSWLQENMHLWPGSVLVLQPIVQGLP